MWILKCISLVTQLNITTQIQEVCPPIISPTALLVLPTIPGWPSFGPQGIAVLQALVGSPVGWYPGLGWN